MGVGMFTALGGCVSYWGSCWPGPNASKAWPGIGQPKRRMGQRSTGCVGHRQGDYMGSRGHGGKVSALYVLRPYCMWDSMEADVGEFVRQCLHCVKSKAGEVMPRFLGDLIRGMGVGEAVQFPFLTSRPVGHWAKMALATWRSRISLSSSRTSAPACGCSPRQRARWLSRLIRLRLCCAGARLGVRVGRDWGRVTQRSNSLTKRCDWWLGCWTHHTTLRPQLAVDQRHDEGHDTKDS